MKYIIVMQPPPKNSHGIDAGTPNNTGFNLPLIDRDGHPRVNGTIDIGPYENPFVNCPADMIIDDSYGAVDGVDQAATHSTGQ